MSGLIFPFSDLISECEAIKAYATGFLDKTSLEVLSEAKSTLQSIASGRNTALTKWQVPADRPLRTVWSNGESQPLNRSAHRVRAEFSFVWEIRKLTDGKWHNGKHFLLEGLASTVTNLVRESDQGGNLVARWTTDVGDANSPGTHFHFQVNRPDSNELPFPKSLDIPRLPAPLMSPFLVVEFALGELFQDRWRRHSLIENRHSNRWRTLHQTRALNFLRWQTTRVEAFTGSPWMALKLAKPPRELLVDEA